MVISTANTRPNSSDPTCHGSGREVVSRAARTSRRKNRTSRLAARRASGSTAGGGSVRRSGRWGGRRVLAAGPPRSPLAAGPPRSPLGGGAYGLSTPVSLPPARWPRPAAANRAGSVACVPSSSSLPGAPGWAAPTPPSPAVLPAKARVVVLISGTGTNLAALLAAHRDPAHHLHEEVPLDVLDPLVQPSFVVVVGHPDRTLGDDRAGVDAGVDTGPIIAQRAVRVSDDDDEARLHERIKDVERDLLVEVVGRVARDGLTVNGR